MSLRLEPGVHRRSPFSHRDDHTKAITRAPSHIISKSCAASMSKQKKSPMVLGYTRSGIPVLLPTHRTPPLEDFVGWSRCDHIDAARILMEHGEREVNEPAGSKCIRWAEVHQATARPPRRAPIRGGAEITILSRRQR